MIIYIINIVRMSYKERTKKPMYVIKNWLWILIYIYEINLSTLKKIGYFFAYNRVIDCSEYIRTRTILFICSHIGTSVNKNCLGILLNSPILNGASITILVIFDNPVLHYPTWSYGMYVHCSVGSLGKFAFRFRTTK